jgi:hypothetical protein
MPQLSHTNAEKLSPEQATGLMRVLELQARWENHRDDPTRSAASIPDLHARQKAFNSFQVAWNGYVAKYRQAWLPEPTQNIPDRLAIWCRTLRAVFQRVEAGCPAQVMAKVYRLVDRIAARIGKEPMERGSVEDVVDAIRELDAVIAWCEARVPLSTLAARIKGRSEDMV